MKSDRRTLTVAAVFLGFLIFIAPFRSYFLFGARFFVSHLTLQDQFVSSSGPSESFMLNIWSIKPPPQQSGPTRDERLGLVLVQMQQNWNTLEAEGRDASSPLEQYCQANPTDLAAKAHLVRLFLNMPSLEKLRDKERLLALARRLLEVASDGAIKEPNNWFWRERKFHLNYLLGDINAATATWIAKPFPTAYDDHVFDDITCKEALYRGQFMDLPRSAYYPLWGGVMFPHFSSGRQLQDVIKSSSEATELRIGEMEFGRAMIRSCPTAIAGAVGIRNIRLGLWDTGDKFANTWQGYYNADKEKGIERAYQQAVSKKDWEYCLRVAKSDIVPRFLRPDENIFGIMVGQFGPLLIYSGIACALIGVGYFLLNRTKAKNLGPHHLVWPMLLAVVTYSDLSFYADMICLAVATGIYFLLRSKFKKLTFDHLGWPSLLLVLSFIGSGWKDWGYVATFSLANSYLFFLLLPLAIWAMVIAARKEKGMGIVPFILLLLALFLGYAYRGWEASSTLYVILYLMQRGNMPLRPWPIAIVLLLAGYHFSIDLSLHTGHNEIHLGYFCLLVILYLMSQHEFEPDQPRFSLVTVGLGAAMLGTILVAQYDNGYKTAMESDLKQIETVRAKYANL
ncbi:MAG: hypothetical protein WCG75_01720 [Armatimonadota bacterium]